jgi:hypothetical protein
MKKLIFLFGLTILTLTSCSKKDDATTTPTTGGTGGTGGTTSTKLPKSISDEAQPSNGNAKNTYYTYDGTKTSLVTTGTSKTEYVYVNDVLSVTKNFSEEVYNSYTKYTFENNDLKSTLQYSVSPTGIEKKVLRTLYTYNTDGTVLTETYTFDTDGVETKSKTSSVSTYSNNNLSKEVVTTKFDDANYTIETTINTYDTKPNYFINVTGSPKNIRKSSNNLLTSETSTKKIENNNNIVVPTTAKENKYVYNASDYVTEVKQYSGGVFNNLRKVNYE